ncbi:MAG: hypothetical protein R2748_32450 [Bryobacterales bacterium]
MPNHWEPDSFEEFQRALDGKRCEVVLHSWTKEWARKRGWRPWWFGFRRQFLQRVRRSERDFWDAYKDGAFNLHRCGTNENWGR